MLFDFIHCIYEIITSGRKVEILMAFINSIMQTIPLIIVVYTPNTNPNYKNLTEKIIVANY